MGPIIYKLIIYIYNYCLLLPQTGHQDTLMIINSVMNFSAPMIFFNALQYTESIVCVLY